MLKQILKKRVDEMQEKLLKITSKLDQITKRRDLDLDGFVSDIGTIRHRLKQAEDKVYKSNVKEKGRYSARRTKT